jgi:hypothetical protein
MGACFSCLESAADSMHSLDEIHHDANLGLGADRADEFSASDFRTAMPEDSGASSEAPLPPYRYSDASPVKGVRPDQLGAISQEFQRSIEGYAKDHAGKRVGLHLDDTPANVSRLTARQLSHWAPLIGPRLSRFGNKPHYRSRPPGSTAHYLSYQDAPVC